MKDAKSLIISHRLSMEQSEQFSARWVPLIYLAIWGSMAGDNGREKLGSIIKVEKNLYV